MKANAQKTKKGNFKLTVVLSEESAQYLVGLLLKNNPRTTEADDPYWNVSGALATAGVDLTTNIIKNAADQG